MISDQIDQDLTEAMKAQEEMKISALRMLKSALKNKEIEKQKPLEDTGVVQVVQGQIKSRKDSIEMYNKGNRHELAEKEIKEIEILKKYLPEQMSDVEIKDKLQKIIEETGAQSIKDMGKVMGRASGEFAGKADMSDVSRIVKEVLAK